MTIKRKVFYSFHYLPDAWRVAQIRNMGIVDGNIPAFDNNWETIKKHGDSAIQNWINSELNGCSCTIVLIGKDTAQRKWINYEIQKSWNDGKGIVGIYIHNLKDQAEKQTAQGQNPFDFLNFTKNQKKLSSIVKTYSSPYLDSKKTYEYINLNLSTWIEEAINIRNNFK